MKAFSNYPTNRCLAVVITALLALGTLYANAQCGEQGLTQSPSTTAACNPISIAYYFNTSGMNVVSQPSWRLEPSSAGSLSTNEGLSTTVTWSASGRVIVTYPVMENGNVVERCSEKSFTRITPEAGSVSGPTLYCEGTGGFTLTVQGPTNTTDLVWQQCTAGSGCSNESNWSPAVGTPSGYTFNVSSITTTTRYRTKLTLSTCSGYSDYSIEKVVGFGSGSPLQVVINDPGPLCSSNATAQSFSVQFGSSYVGSNSTYEWFRNGGNGGEPEGPGDMNPEPHIYDPYDGTYGFQLGETIQVKVTSGNPCDANNPGWSNLVTLQQLPETFPSLNPIAYTPNPICSDNTSVIFTVSTSAGNNISGNWHLGPGGFSSTGSQYLLSPGNILSMANENERVVFFSGTITGSCGTSQPVSTNTNVLQVFQSRYPEVRLGNISICEGNTSPITAIPSDAVGLDISYDWYVNDILKAGNHTSTLSQSEVNVGDVIRVVMTVADPVCATPSDEATGTFNRSPIVPISAVINNPNPVCDGAEVRGLVFQLDENASNIGSNPTFRWLRNGVFDEQNPFGIGDTNNDPKIYDPYDETYGFQIGDRVELQVDANIPCASPSTASSGVIQLVEEPEVFPAFEGIENVNPICLGAQAVFKARTNEGVISGNWSVGTGGFPSTTSEYILNAEDVNGLQVFFSGTVTGSCGTQQPVTDQTDVLIAHPQPQVTANNDHVCTGESTDIFISSDIPGMQYTWDVAYVNIIGPPGVGSGSVINNKLNIIQPGEGTATYSIIGTSPEGCIGETTQAVAVVTSNPVNPSLPSNEFCDFQPVILQGITNSNIVDYHWYENTEVPLGQGETFPLNVMPAGSYGYKYKAVDALGCVGETYSNVNVNVVSACDDKMNWIETITFEPIPEGTGITSHSKNYFDAAGNLVQSQSINLPRDEVWASQSVKDEVGREAISTLEAPLGQADFQYKHWFVTDANGNLYDHTKFDQSVGNAPGTLGWYYSTNNNIEQEAPKSQFPYSRADFYEDGTSQVKRSAAPGDVHKMGQGHEVTMGTFPVFGELNDYVSRRNTILGVSALVSGLANEAVQSVTRDENGRYTISISDKFGKGLMSFRSGSAEDHVLLISNSVQSSGDLASDYYRPMTYFYILHDQPVSITGSADFLVENLLTNERKAPGMTFAEVGGDWPAGFYRVILNNPTSQVTIAYSNYLLDASCQFYDDAGRLRVSVSPNGYKSWNEGTAYSLIDKTTYKYNHQGWLLSITEPDAGETKYMYSKDGKIRFSQNAEQLSKNAFSYTHYDRLGRPVESGEYVGTALMFGSAAMEVELDKRADEVSWLDSDKTDWVKTFYDIPDAQIIGLPSGFRQDFVRGGVSYTENANIKTWYSYDEFGRVSWMAQKVAALGEAFVSKYTYDFLGNVIEMMNSSCANATLTFPFFHHYEYDAKKRLSMVHTSTDGTTKKVRATYEYYPHGPLKRVELGEKIQGVDFVYNIQGWLTQINHPEGGLADPGKDGQSGDHSDIKTDVFGMVIDYYESALTGILQTSAIFESIDPSRFHNLPEWMGPAQEIVDNRILPFRLVPTGLQDEWKMRLMKMRSKIRDKEKEG